MKLYHRQKKHCILYSVNDKILICNYVFTETHFYLNDLF